MREYELVCLVHPELDESAFTELINRIRGWITDNGGMVLKVDLWGKRKLAYAIRKQSEGQYVLFHTQMDPKYGVQLERNLRFVEPVLRFLLIVKD